MQMIGDAACRLQLATCSVQLLQRGMFSNGVSERGRRYVGQLISGTLSGSRQAVALID